MKKKYLKTVEDILALKDTDTKIYREDADGYYQFVNGVICRFFDGYWLVGSYIDSDDKSYILEEEPMQSEEKPVKEADENDIGKLCWFWDNEENAKAVDILKDTSIGPRHFERKTAGWYYHCRRLSPSEVAEITGYKVEEK